ncbi:enoyl-CoA hydratase [Mangrovimicrobium sediminis]|uniref:Enoyl-CoA hydratase n=1 Tax=Mangrovimicrobium sediminis TaxID=2562682 RepID=A0A4Z0LVD6_9GAMM|nr:enoyl-CoA hydratase [Haliea sp. SAOS-164]TGD71292.1 enoyl-CoA hydratase [Haliea sp. SAOS-164]
MSDTVLYEASEGIAHITLNRPEVHNAQNPELLARLDECWTAAARDDSVKVILLRANGKNFSAGHDLSVKEDEKDVFASFDWETRGITGQYLWEQSHYFEYSRRWRNNPKPSIAAVQGACVAAGLMLCWPCDLIIAADNAWFSDPTIIMGIAGVEYHGHTWELGPRKAKQMLFTAERITAHDAEKLGMVNEVVALDELGEAALGMARKIAEQDLFSLMMAKRVVNQTMDTMGQPAALQAAFDIHEFQHTQCLARSAGKSAVLTRDVSKLKQNNTKG